VKNSGKYRVQKMSWANSDRKQLDEVPFRKRKLMNRKKISDR
jgi:hypothetical protein